MGADSAVMESGTLLQDRVCLVTGGARGGGEAIARTLAAQGARVLIGDINDVDGERVAAEAPGLVYQHLDVTSEDNWEQAVATCMQRWQRLDVLVNCAAVLHLGSIENTSAEDFRRLCEVNALGPFLGIRAVLPVMKAAGGGAIVNIGSVDGLHGQNGLSAYGASKWALRGLSRSAAMELGRSNIRVNQVCPSDGSAEMFADWAEQLAAAAADVQDYFARRALPRPGTLQELANAVLFLASDQSRYCAGIDLVVDGGLTAGNFIPAFNDF